ncbi:class I SAM-dependent methyltransferase [Rasiella rasia]|uniref:Class I SAM-dependent methyltransferase n=1 Tax=Rasiella rasia TaxID=2744027 RepID=A0A6G6GI10_9FLAO|nr:class I SAM-dependent methyltransferase [Rasiella rasia]QIE58053.1 class I SAM-dependent methyltransferase [Rasiella rasia]
MNFEKIAKQLANPSGKFGVDVALGMNTMNEFISKTTYELLKIKDNESVLEIGLGNGKFIKDILNYGSRISFTGIDISETMIIEAKKNNSSLIETEYVDLFDADVEKIPVWDETLDKICTINTIYFWKNPVKALEEIYRVLRPNGILIVSFRPFIEGQTLNFTKYGFKEYRAEDFEYLIQQTAFKIVKKIEKTEPEVEFNEQKHNLLSKYFIVKKLPPTTYIK